MFGVERCIQCDTVDMTATVEEALLKLKPNASY